MVNAADQAIATIERDRTNQAGTKRTIVVTFTLDGELLPVRVETRITGHPACVDAMASDMIDTLATPDHQSPP
jgi:DNA-binding transcriptional LysR family regulator